jgi:ADP-heptose:LPS heptosyltransferase/glycosyltransferase involved in cell wall biosynthesis
MHLMVDLQGAQAAGRGTDVFRGILSLARAVVRTADANRVTFVLSGLFPLSIKPITAALSGTLPNVDIRVWRAIGPTRESILDNKWRREVAERMREAFIATLRPDVLLITGCFEGYDNEVILSMEQLAARIPTIAVLIDPPPQPAKIAQLQPVFCAETWHRRRLVLLAKCRKILTIFEWSGREIAAELNLAAGTVGALPVGCEPSFRDLGLSAQAKQGIRATHGIDKPYIFHVGRGGEPGGPLGLIQAFSQLDQALAAEYQLVFAGFYEPEEMETLKEASSSAELNADAVRFTGDALGAELVNLYNACALFVLPASYAQFSLSILEAMACGSPVLAANTASARESIGSEEGLFDPASVGALAAILRRALTDEAFRARLMAHGKERMANTSIDESARHIWQESLKLRGASQGAASSLVNVDRTGIFRPRDLKILVTKLDHLGDFILSIPALAKLRARYPHAAIDIIVGSWNAGFARDLNLFRNIYSFDFFKRKSSEMAVADDTELVALLRNLETYDIAIDLRRQPESRFLLVRTSAALKVGYQTLDPSIDAQLDIVLRTYRDASHIRTPLNKTPIAVQILRLIDALPVEVNDYISLPRIGAGAGREPGRVAIFPKAGTDVREWDPQRVRQLVDQFLASVAVRDVQLFFVNKTDAAQYAFRESDRLKVNIGLDFSSMTRLLASSGLCIANNSGGIHLASYLGVPTIGIYSGHELSAEWGPQFHDSVVIHRGAACAPCHLGRKEDCPYGNFCLGDISVDDVYRKSMEAIGDGKFRDHSPLHSTQDVGLQISNDNIVRNLIVSLGESLKSRDQAIWLEVSAAIASNHPAYLVEADRESAGESFLNTVLDHKCAKLEWQGFSLAESAFRWSDGTKATIQFYLEDETQFSPDGRLLLVLDTYRRQHISVKFNGIHVFDAVKAGRNLLLSIPVQNLRYGLNRLEFWLPDATSPGRADARLLGVAVRKLKIVVEDEASSATHRQVSRWKDSQLRRQ